KQLSVVKATGEQKRYHVLDSEVQKAVKAAADAAGIPKRVTPHTFRHTFASHLLQANVDIRTIQARLGHSDVRTTMIYTHTVPSRTIKDVGSPLDMA
ncbi:MAG: tyrosine-type recombinase/integrase, partial [Kiritimatiellia bacterium]